MVEIPYRIKVKKADYEIDVQGDKDWVEKKFEELTKASSVETAPNVPNIPHPAIPGQTTGTPLSIVEFLRSKGNSKRHSDRILIFCYWLHHYKKIGSYNVKDIESCYSEARINPPKNLSDSLNKIQAKGYLMPASEEKESMKTWVITQSGEDYINELK